jgi:hypothetical protein
MTARWTDDSARGLHRPDISVARCKRLYERGLTVDQVAAESKCSPDTVIARLKEGGVALRMNGTRLMQMRAAARRLAKRRHAAGGLGA